MIHKVFTIHDAKANAYLPPFFLPEEGMAVRTFGDCVNNPEHSFGAHPEDYNLFVLGTWDDAIGKIDTYEMAKILGNGVTFLDRGSESDPEEMMKTENTLRQVNGEDRDCG